MQPIKTALCSFGMSGWVFHAPFIHLHKGFELYAVYERTKDLAAAKYPGIKTFRSLEAMLADEAIELVVVNTPNYTHFEYAKLALLAGKHVIIEKPFTNTVAEGEELVALAEKQQRKLSVYQNRRWDSDFRTVHKIVQQRSLGEIVEAEIHFDRFNESLSYKQHKETPGPGAGILPDLGPHLIDQALQLFGMPDAVFADATNLRPISQVEDYFELLLFYKNSRVRLKAGYLVREALPSYIIHGTKGSFIKPRADVQERDLQKEKSPAEADWGTEPEAGKGLLHTEIDGKLIREYIPSEKGNYMAYYEGIYDALRNDKPLPVTGAEALSVIRIIEAAFKSVAEKKDYRVLIFKSFMLLLGIDIGTSAVKVAVVDAATQLCIATTQYPETESGIISINPGWAEQSPETWWEQTQQAILKLHAQKKYNPQDIASIGIAYQMHGLVMVDKDQHVLRNSIIWCDSRAVEIGDKAFAAIGEEKCLQHLLNSPGNFTASKLAWVKENEPELYAKIDKIMLPGDFIAMKLTGNITTSISALSEGIFWDFKNNELSADVMNYFGFSNSFIPECKNVFDEHGRLSNQVATALNLKPGIPVSYKAGDQPNNALSLNVLQPGEVAATAGTSGVIYGVSDKAVFDPQSRVNAFAHVNHTPKNNSIGTLLCINGAGFSYSAAKQKFANDKTYSWMNAQAAKIKPGSEGLFILPFGNGAERMLNNKIIGSQYLNYNDAVHTDAHIFRAVQEGIAFAFRYGMDIMKENNLEPKVIRAGKANMFLSDVFAASFVNALDIPVELYNNDGSIGAAIGAGIGAGVYSSFEEAFSAFKPAGRVEPTDARTYDDLYYEWRSKLLTQLN